MRDNGSGRREWTEHYARKMPGKEWLKLSAVDTAVRDLSPLRGHPALKEIVLSGTPVTDVSPLATIPTLDMVWLYGTAVEDVSCLAGLPLLKDLNLRKKKVTDLSSFQGAGGYPGHCPLRQWSGFSGLDEGFPGRESDLAIRYLLWECSLNRKGEGC